MTAEEKARAYDEVLNKLRHFIAKGVDPLITRADAQDFFPELKESEDERIMGVFRDFAENYLFWEKSGLTKEKALAWIEKQGKNDMGISETTKKKLEDNLNKALEKETPESWNAFLEKQGEQKPVAKYKVGDTIYYNSFGRLVSFVIANIVEDGTDNPMYEDKDGNSVFQNDIVERKPVFEMITPEESLGIDSDTYNKIVDECIYGEQKPTNKVEPKFKVGDWIVNNNNKYVYQVTKIRDDEYCLCPLDAKVMGDLRIIDIDNDCHLWTIQDAKDGDVLAEDSCIFIIQKLGDNSIAAKTYCTLYDDGDFDDGSILYFDIDSTKPATKEQRDLLFSKMKKAGYKWDTEKKKLKEIIVDENQIKKNLQDNSFRRMFEQKPVCSKEQREKESLSDIENRIINFAMQFHDNRMKPEAEWEDEVKMLRDNIKIDPWSEEDEYILSHIINDLKFLKDTISIDPNYIINITDIEREINWFKSLKNRVQPQTKQEWSERDELMLEESIGFIKSSPYPYAGDTLRGEISKIEAENWIKHLKNRVQPQQEWSKEDEKILDGVITNYESGYLPSVEKRDEIIEKLESLKERYTWRPSEEQMKGIECTIKTLKYQLNAGDNRLNSLYEDLKKLREK